MTLTEYAQTRHDGPPGLPPGLTVVRWLACEGASPERIAAWHTLLDDDERARAGRFHFAEDRCAYIAAHALARAMLARFGGLPPTAWLFARSDFGKPRIHPDLGVHGLQFNLSHTRGLVACAASRDEVGVDVEWLDRRQSGIELANRYFTPQEAALLAARPAAEQRATFFRLWTLKEAVMKATGLGLHLSLDAFSIALDPLGVTFHRHVADASETWTLGQQAVTSRHMLGVASRCRHGAFEIAPLG